MLEAPSLWIHPWQRTGAVPRNWTRLVTDGSTSAALGRVNWLGPPERSWFDWLRGQRLEVLETDDAALLLTLVRPWGLSRLWDVYDAEERRVGSIAALMLLDGEGDRRGYLDRHDHIGGRILDPTSHLLAEYGQRPDQVTQMRFAPGQEINPFLRMLLLGCVLTQQVPPPHAADR
jgi:hypothetical protein